MTKPELLLPAGTLDRLKTAFMYGADVVYCGLPSVSLRAKSGFTTADLKQGIDYAHSIGKKVYLTLNLFTHNGDLERLTEAVKMLQFLKPDGVIVADPAVFDYVGQICPDIARHISTQANVCSYMTVQFWQKQGAKLCVLGREVPLKEMRDIREKCPDIKIEVFVHGAMCISYSGRCLLSNFLTGRSANKGNCAHTCRWKYKVYLEEENRPNELMRLDEDDHGAYVMNSRDLCLMPRLNELLDVGLDSFKIEGRNKSEYYVSVTARAYRKAIDDWVKDPKNWKPDAYMAELSTLQNRGYTLGFFDGNAGPESLNYEISASGGDWRYAG
ncbi:MAG: peptidase U32 family protein, partial [Alphaproteobacteria bacterium]